MAIAVSKMVTTVVRHYDQDERHSYGSMHWDTIMSVLLKAFAKHGARQFSEKYWLYLVHEGSSKARNEYCEDSTKSLAYFQATRPELMGYVRIPYHWKKYVYHRGCSVSLQSILENGLIQGGHGGDKDDRLTVFFTPLNPFRRDSDEEEPRDDYTIPQKAHHSH